MSRVFRAAISAGLAASVAFSGVVVASPAVAASTYPCGSESSSAVGTLVSLALPATATAGNELRMPVKINCEGDRQAVLARMQLVFENDQGITTTISVDEAGIEAGPAEGFVQAYTVTVPTAGGALPEGLQRLVRATPIMEAVPQFPSGSQQPRYSRAYVHPYLSLHRPVDWEVRVGHPTHAAPTPEVPWAFTAGVPAEVRFPAWGRGAVLSYRWLLEDGTVVSDRKEYVPAVGSLARLVVTGSWPDGTVHERSSRLVRTVDAGGGFNDVTVTGPAVPYSEQAVRATRTAPVQSSRSGWYRLRSDGAFSTTREAAAESWYPKPTDVGQRFQFIENGLRQYGTSPIVTVGPAPLPADRRSGYVHGDTLVNTVAELLPRLQPGYRMTAHNPWPVGQTVTYTWLRDGKAIPGATTPTHQLAVADAGTTIQPVVRTSSPGYVTNEAKAKAVKIPLVKLQSAKPLVHEPARVGVTLRARTPGWTAGTRFSYQWLRDGRAIPGATRSSYAATAADRNHVVQVRVTGTQPKYTTATQISAHNLINYGVLAAPTPRITGTAQAGRTLTAQAGTWTSGTKLQYQWYRNGKVIKGATRTTYRLAAADKGQSVKVRVRGIKAGFTGQDRFSAAKRIAR